MFALKVVLTVLIGYLLGNFSTGVVLSRMNGGEDIRKKGSGNAGATNMLRINGRAQAALTLLGDMIKGMLGVAAGWLIIGGDLGGLIGGFSAVVGHDFPALLHFKGGKGIATSFGALLLMYPVQSILLLLTFILVVALTHYVSVGSVVSAMLYPFYIVLTVSLPPVCVALCFAFGVLAIFCHRANIRRLLAGKENRLDFALLKGKKPQQ